MDTRRHPAPEPEPHEGEDLEGRGGDTPQDPRIERAVPPPAPERR